MPSWPYIDDNKNKRKTRDPNKPISESLGKKPPGARDFEAGVWRDKNGTIVGRATNEDSGYRPGYQTRNRTKNPIMSLSSVARRRLQRKYGG